MSPIRFDDVIGARSYVTSNVPAINQSMMVIDSNFNNRHDQSMMMLLIAEISAKKIIKKNNKNKKLKNITKMQIFLQKKQEKNSEISAKKKK